MSRRHRNKTNGGQEDESQYIKALTIRFKLGPRMRETVGTAIQRYKDSEPEHNRGCLPYDSTVSHAVCLREPSRKQIEQKRRIYAAQSLGSDVLTGARMPDPFVFKKLALDAGFEAAYDEWALPEETNDFLVLEETPITLTRNGETADVYLNIHNDIGEEFGEKNRHDIRMLLREARLSHMKNSKETGKPQIVPRVCNNPLPEYITTEERAYLRRNHQWYIDISEALRENSKALRDEDLVIGPICKNRRYTEWHAKVMVFATIIHNAGFEIRVATKYEEFILPIYKNGRYANVDLYSMDRTSPMSIPEDRKIVEDALYEAREKPWIVNYYGKAVLDTNNVTTDIIENLNQHP